MTKATPRPWSFKNKEILGAKGSHEFHWQWGDKKTVANHVDESDAALIVRAVNCHDELVKVLDLYIGFLEDEYSYKDEKLEALLKRAKDEA